MNVDTLEVDSFFRDVTCLPCILRRKPGNEATPTETWERLAVDQDLHHIRIDLN